MAKDYIKRAERCLLESESAFSDGDYPMAVRRAQECVELSLKAALRAFAIEYPKRHDVGDALNLLKGKAPAWFSSRIPHLSAVSSDLARKRGQPCTATSRNSNRHLSYSAAKTLKTLLLRRGKRLPSVDAL